MVQVGLLYTIDRLDLGHLSVPPVGVEPTLWTLLGGRPLPLGYEGVPIIPLTQLSSRGSNKDLFA